MIYRFVFSLQNESLKTFEQRIYLQFKLKPITSFILIAINLMNNIDYKEEPFFIMPWDLHPQLDRTTIA